MFGNPSGGLFLRLFGLFRETVIVTVVFNLEKLALHACRAWIVFILKKWREIVSEMLQIQAYLPYELQNWVGAAEIYKMCVYLWT